MDRTHPRIIDRTRLVAQTISDQLRLDTAFELCRRLLRIGDREHLADIIQQRRALATIEGCGDALRESERLARSGARTDHQCPVERIDDLLLLRRASVRSHNLTSQAVKGQ